MHLLTYGHMRNLFSGTEFQNWVEKYFENVSFEGAEFGNYFPKIKVSNWGEVKHLVPKSYKPIKVEKIDSQ